MAPDTRLTVPMTSTKSASFSSFRLLWNASGSDSPKKVMSGHGVPPQSHDGNVPSNTARFTSSESCNLRHERHDAVANEP